MPGRESHFLAYLIGVVDALGKDVPSRWQVDQRVGVGWHAYHCGYCDACRRGDFFVCQTGVKSTGVSIDGGYADYMIAPVTALAMVLADLPATEGAPQLCAGLTTFNALRNSGARAGDVVAVLGPNTADSRVNRPAYHFLCKTSATRRYFPSPMGRRGKPSSSDPSSRARPPEANVWRQ